MAKINLDNIQKQLSRAEAEYEEAELNSKPMSLAPNEIILNPNNTAGEDDTEDSIRRLADSIGTAGLIHPLTVNRLSEHKYMLLSGERRYKAITTFLHWNSIPCTVYELNDADMVTLVTVQANMEAREYTVAQRLKLYKELDNSLRKLKAKGKYKGGIGRGIAQMLGVSEQQIGKYKRLSEQLSAEELTKVSNIDKAIKELPQRQKTESDFQFLFLKHLKKALADISLCILSDIADSDDLDALTICRDEVESLISKHSK